MSYHTIPNTVLTIRKQEMTCDNKICDGIPKPLSCYSAAYLISGSAGSGKTNWITSILGSNRKNGNRQGLKKCFDHVIICSPSLATLKNNIFRDLADDKKWDEFNEAFIEFVIEFTDHHAAENAENTLVILDDVTSQLKKNMHLQKKLTYLLQNRRHRRLSFFVSVQRIVDVPTGVRDSITHMVLFRPRNKREIDYVANEYLPVAREEVNALLSFIFDAKYNFLFLDMSLKNSDQYLYYKNFDQIVL